MDGPVAPRAGVVRLVPLPFDAVTLDPGSFLGRWQSVNREATVPHVLEQLEQAGTIDNFLRRLGRSDAEHRGFNFVDSDVYKTLEAIAWEAGRLELAHHTLRIEWLDGDDAAKAWQANGW